MNELSSLFTAALLAWSAPASAQPSPSLELDPVTDTTVLASTAVLSVSLQLILDTGELRPQEPGDPNDLLFIDRWRAGSDDFGTGHLSNVGLGLVIGYAVVDTFLTAILERGDPWYHYAVVYAEAAAITALVTNLVKIAVRRPRPTAYHPDAISVGAGDDTNSALSFFSGHASISAALAATAIYLAFTREASPVERWVVFSAGILLAGFVAVMRVSEGKHFPTDVIAGSVTGAAIGVLVPHLHAVTEDDPDLAVSATGFRLRF